MSRDDFPPSSSRIAILPLSRHPSHVAKEFWDIKRSWIIFSVLSEERETKERKKSGCILSEKISLPFRGAGSDRNQCLPESHSAAAAQ